MTTGLNKTIVALDQMNAEQMLSFIERTRDDLEFFKIGMQSFYKYGRDFLVQVQDKYQAKIFLDLKLHDIPNTVAGAIESLAGLPLEFLTLHLSGGQKMCEYAVQARDKYLPETKLLGVSLLTSLSRQDFQQLWNQNSQQDTTEQMLRLIDIAETSKIDGIVCSPHELPLMQGKLTVCPGIRFSDEITNNSTQDQSRVMDPKTALSEGAGYLVVGRSLTQATDLEQRLAELRNINT